MCIKLSHFIKRIRSAKFVFVVVLLSGVLGPLAHAEVGQCISLFLSNEEEAALQIVKTKLSFIQRRAGVEHAAARKVERLPVISSTAEAEMIEIIKHGTGPNLLLDEVNINVKGSWEILVKKKTTIKNIQEVLNVFTMSVDGFRQTLGNEHADVLVRIQKGLRESLEVTVARMSREEASVFVTTMRSILLENSLDYWEIRPILSQIRDLKVAGSGWVLMLTEVNDFVLRNERPGQRRDQVTSAILKMINESFQTLNQMNNANLDRYFQYALKERKLLIPLVKSAVAIPETFTFRFKYILADLLSDMDGNSAGDGYLIAKELHRRGIAKKEVLHFVNLIIDSGTLFVGEEGLKMFQALKAELEK